MIELTHDDAIMLLVTIYQRSHKLGVPIGWKYIPSLQEGTHPTRFDVRVISPHKITTSLALPYS